MRITLRTIVLATCLMLPVAAAPAQQSSGALHGKVTDQDGASIVGASITLKSSVGVEKAASTDGEGRFVISSIAPGSYAVRVTAQGFAAYEQADVGIVAGRGKELNVRLDVALAQEEVNVKAERGLSTEPGGNANALVLRDSDLETLPEDPEELAAALQALAGVSVGPSGGQIEIDGFINRGEPLPPRSSIREVRINENPFSAENDRVGFGRIQIITRPGTDKLRGQAFFNFNEEHLNTRNPFAPRRTPYEMRNYGGNLSGPLVPRRASFFLSLTRTETNDNALINARVLDENLNSMPFVNNALVPRRQSNLNARFDFQLNNNHTLTARYNFYRNRTENAGTGGTSLPERAFALTLPIHTLQLTETAVIGAGVINEIRFQYIGENQFDEPVSSQQSINVLGAFAGGGSNSGRASNPEGRLTLQNSTLWTARAHTFRVGVRLRRTTITDISPDDFNGTFTFGGGLAPQLDASGTPLRDAQGRIVSTAITSLERYRRTLLFQRQGFTPEDIRARGGGATQLTLGGGNPRATAEQIDFGSYLQDDWRARPNLTIGLGLRYEFQTNINKNLNLAPRVSFGWSPGSEGGPHRSQTVVRGGFGVFFDRFNENQVLVVNKYAAGDSFRFVVSDPSLLDAFPVLPSIETLRASYSATRTTFRLADDLREPYMMQGAISVERLLPFKTTISAAYVTARVLHALRARNVNAPVTARDSSGTTIIRNRPLGEVGNVIQYESSGRLNQNQFVFTLNNRFSQSATFFAAYTLNKASGDTEGVRTLPANSHDLRSEYGRSSFDVRHTFSATGTFDMPFGLKLSPLIFASSGRPFNITTGSDTNGDSIFNDRPALATSLVKPGIVNTLIGAFDPDPQPGQQIIPRNFGTAPGYFIVNLNVTRTFAFGKRETAGTRTQGQQTGVGGTRANNEARYRLILGVRAINLLNRVNLDLPVGNLSSPFFGQSVATAGGFGAASVGNPASGNRRLEMQIRFEF